MNEEEAAKLLTEAARAVMADGSFKKFLAETGLDGRVFAEMTQEIRGPMLARPRRRAAEQAMAVQLGFEIARRLR